MTGEENSIPIKDIKNPQPFTAISDVANSFSNFLYGKGDDEKTEAHINTLFKAVPKINERLQDESTFGSTVSDLYEAAFNIRGAYDREIRHKYQDVAYEKILQIIGNNIDSLEKNLGKKDKFGRDITGSIFKTVCCLSARDEEKAFQFIDRHKDEFWKVMQDDSKDYMFLREVARFVGHCHHLTSMDQFLKEFVDQGFQDKTKQKIVVEIAEDIFDYNYQTAGEKYLFPILEKLGLSTLQIKDLVTAWKSSSARHQKSKLISHDNITSFPQAVRINLETILELDQSNKEIVKTLLEEFNIKCFGRYPTELLINQYEMRSKEGPYPVIVAAIEDGNGSGYAEKDIWAQLFTDLGTGNLLRVTEIEDKDLRAQYERLRKIYSSPIAGFNIIDAHGSAENMYFSSYDELTIEDIRLGLLDGLNAIFDPKIVHVLNSCSTGQGIAQEFSAKVKGKVIAPTTDTAIEKIEIKKDANNITDIKVDYREGKTVIFENGIEGSYI